VRSGPRWPATGRLAAAVTLLLLAAAGARARDHARLGMRGLIGDGVGTITGILGFVLVVIASIVLAGLVVLLARRRRRKDDDYIPVSEPAGTWWQRTVALLAVLALVALLVSALVVGIRASRGSRAGSSARAPALPAAPHLPGPATAPAAGTGIIILLAVLAGLAVITLTAFWWRRRRRAAPVPVVPPSVPSPLAAAVAAGSSALAGASDAREAIIGCYAAMEESLAAAGSPRLAADTPEELLARAVGEGVTRTPAAAVLTRLFREARFSPHTLGGHQRSAAESALADIARDLAGNR
jgi:hypothetical protein